MVSDFGPKRELKKEAKPQKGKLMPNMSQNLIKNNYRFRIERITFYARLRSFMPLIVLTGLVNCHSQRTNLLILIFVFVTCVSQQIQREKMKETQQGN